MHIQILGFQVFLTLKDIHVHEIFQAFGVLVDEAHILNPKCQKGCCTLRSLSLFTHLVMMNYNGAQCGDMV